MFKYIKIALFTIFVVVTTLYVNWFIQTNFYKSPVVSASNNPTPKPLSLFLDENDLLNLVNNWRVSENKKPFLISDSLCEMAIYRLDQIKTDFSHDGFTSSDFKKRFYWEGNIGENLAESARPDVLSRWLGSPGHRENLERNYTHTCIKTNGEYVVQIFGYY